MNREDIIKNAAERSGIPYPLDENTRELCESIIRSLDDGIAWAHGKPHNLKSGFKERLEEWKREAEIL
jgi:hypothetical protein